MSFRFNKRVKLGKNLGVNISKSGITPNYKTKLGRISTKGYSIRTGIPGLSYRKNFSNAKKGGCILALIPWVILALILSCSSSEQVNAPGPCRDTNCADYISQASAQAAYEADPECRNDLDRDNDGIACEEPGNSIKTCATTSNCGCSGKNKSPCEADPCCKWIVGTGCKCK